MSFDDMYATEREANEQQLVGQQLPVRPNSIWQGIASAVPRGVATAVNETARAVNRAGSLLYGAGDFFMNAGAVGAPDAFAPRADVSADPVVDQALRSGADYWKSDPEKTGRAAQVVEEFSRVGSKFVAASALTGPVAGAAITGASEGETQREGMVDRGVDADTARQLGVVHGVTTGVGFLLPAGGKTLLTTAGLVLAGGAGSHIAEAYPSREILQNAGYDDIAREFDPWDPTSLLLSTGLAALGGAVHTGVRMRNERAAARAPSMEPTSDNIAAAAAPPDVVDAARVVFKAEQQANSTLGPLDPISMTQHTQALEVAHQQAEAGQPVSVPKAPVDEARIAATEDAVLRRVTEQIVERPSKPVAEMTREELLHELMTDQLTGLGNRRAYLENANQPVHASIDVDSLKWVNDNMGGHEAGDMLLRNVGQALRDEGIDAYRLSGDEFAAQFPDRETAEAALGRASDRLRNATISHETENSLITFNGVKFSHALADTYRNADALLPGVKADRERRGLRAGRGEEPAGVLRADKGQAGQVHNDAPAAPAVGSQPAPGAAERATTSPELERALRVLADNPDLEVRMGEGDDAPRVTARELLEQARADVEQATKDAEAFQAAAGCAIRRGQ